MSYRKDINNSKNMKKINIFSKKQDQGQD